MLPKNFPYRKELKRKDAAERQAKYDVLTPQHIINLLDSAFGVGCGAAKQRARLNKKLQLVAVVAANQLALKELPEKELPAEKEEKKKYRKKAKS